jgi:hypothetical protein
VGRRHGFEAFTDGGCDPFAGGLSSPVEKIRRRRHGYFLKGFHATLSYRFAIGLIDRSPFHPDSGSSVQKAAIVSPDVIKAVIDRGREVNRIARSEITRDRQGSGQKFDPVQQTIADRNQRPDFVFQVFEEKIA